MPHKPYFNFHIFHVFQGGALDLKKLTSRAGGLKLFFSKRFFEISNIHESMTLYLVVAKNLRQ